MGLCGSKSSRRSTCGSEKSEKCRWDKHGNVFFPVRRFTQQKQQQIQQKNQPAGVFSSTTNPVFEGLDSSVQSKGGHFANFTKFLKMAKGSSTRTTATGPDNITNSKSCRTGYKDLLIAAGFRKEQDDTKVAENKPCKFKVMEPEKTGGSVNLGLSRSSSSKDGTLTRSSSAKEAAVSSQKEGTAAEVGDAAASNLPKTSEEILIEEDILLETAKQSPSSERENTIDPRSVEAVVKSGFDDKSSKPENVISVSSSFLTRGLGMPSCQPLIFCAGSPDKCRGRNSSTHSSLSGEEFNTSAVRSRRRRSPNKVSPSRRSPGKRSPNKRTAVNNGIMLNSSAARFQRSLPRRTSENMPPQFSEYLANSFRPPKSSVTTKNKNRVDRSVLKELQGNCRNLPPRPAVINDWKLVDHPGTEPNAPLLDGDIRSGSKRLRSPQKPGTTGSGDKSSREHVNVNLSLPSRSGSQGSLTDDKHVGLQTDKNMPHDKDVSDHKKSESGSLAERDLLELLERTPKKLKKMALKLALMIELEHSKEDENYSGELNAEKLRSSSGETAQTNAYVKCNGQARKASQGKSREDVDLDLELKLGMGNENRRRRGDNVRVGLSFNLDSPSRTGSVSLPTTPRSAVSPICNGLSVEARIGSSRDLSCSDISFRILKNPDKLFGSVNHPRTQNDRSGPATGGKFHVETCRDKAMLGSQGTCQIDIYGVRNEQASETKTCMNARNDCTHNVERCSSFNFKNDKPYGVDDDLVEQHDGKSSKFDLNSEVQWGNEGSPTFEFEVKSDTRALVSDPATPNMLSGDKKPKETDALSLSADEIAEIWGAFEAGQQDTPTKCES